MTLEKERLKYLIQNCIHYTFKKYDEKATNDYLHKDKKYLVGHFLVQHVIYIICTQTTE